MLDEISQTQRHRLASSQFRTKMAPSIGTTIVLFADLNIAASLIYLSASERDASGPQSEFMNETLWASLESAGGLTVLVSGGNRLVRGASHLAAAVRISPLGMISTSISLPVDGQMECKNCSEETK